MSQFLQIKYKNLLGRTEVILRKLCEVGDVLLRYIVKIILIKKNFKHSSFRFRTFLIDLNIDDVV